MRDSRKAGLYAGKRCCCCLPTKCAMRAAIFLPFLWALFFLVYGVYLFVRFRGVLNDLSTEALIYKIVFLVLQTPFLVNMFFQFRWLCFDSLKVRRGLVIGYSI